MDDSTNTSPDQGPSSGAIGEISHGPSKLEEFFEKNLKLIIIGVVLLLIAIASYVVLRGLKKESNTQAAQAFYEASDDESLTSVIEEFPQAPASGTAALALAQRQWDTGYPDDAMKSLDQVLNNKSVKLLHPRAHYAKGSYHFLQGQMTEAQSEFLKAAQNDQDASIVPMAYVGLGDLERSAGKLDAARQNYQLALSELETHQGFGVESFKGMIDQRLQLLGLDLPEKVAPPAPEEPNEDAVSEDDESPESSVDEELSSEDAAEEDGESAEDDGQEEMAEDEVVEEESEESETDQESAENK